MAVRCKPVQHGVALTPEQFEIINNYLDADCENHEQMQAVREVILNAELPSNAIEFMEGSELIKVYRGMTFDWEEDGSVSWTTNYDMAKSFTNLGGWFEGTVASVELTVEQFKAACIWAVEANEGFEEWEIVMRPEVIRDFADEFGDFEYVEEYPDED